MPVELDWQEYFADFCFLHGKPVELAGRLWFPDGWSYSAFDYAGPEWGPPTERTELKRIKQQYWETRRIAVLTDLNAAAAELKTLEQAQQLRSVPLKQRVGSRGDDGKRIVTSSAIDWEALLLRERELKLEMDEVLKQLKLIEQGELHASTTNAA